MKLFAVAVVLLLLVIAYEGWTGWPQGWSKWLPAALQSKAGFRPKWRKNKFGNYDPAVGTFYTGMY